MASIKQIVNFQLKVLRVAGFVEFVQQVAKLVKDFRDSGEEGQSQLPTKVEPVYTSFKDSVTAVDDAYKLSRASDYTQKIADEDDRRDNLFRQLVNLLKMYRRFGYDTEKKDLWNIVKKYNVDPVENYSEESSKLQQMLQELHADTQAGQHLTLLGLESLITQLNTANEAVRTLMGQRNDERMQIGKAALATAREEADQAYRALILSLNASAVMDDDAHRFDALISQVNELIKYYRLYVVPKGGKKDEEGGSSTGNNNGGDNPTPNPQPNPGGDNPGGDDSGGNTPGGNPGGDNPGGNDDEPDQ